MQSESTLLDDSEIEVLKVYIKALNQELGEPVPSVFSHDELASMRGTFKNIGKFGNGDPVLAGREHAMHLLQLIRSSTMLN